MFFVKYAYIFIIAIFVIVIFLIYSERLLSINSSIYNLVMNLAIVGVMSIIIFSTLLNSYKLEYFDDSSFFVKMFNSVASKNMIMFYGCVIYILYLNNTESFDNNYVHYGMAKLNLGDYIKTPWAQKVNLGNYISNRTVGIIMLLATVFITARALHVETAMLENAD